ncbi:MAG: ATP-binding protein [Treponema sp.]|nr:ATP-binding protein [Treponema sp.]
MVFTKAVKTKQWLRLAIDGISGSGKTYTALATAAGIAEALSKLDNVSCKIALIDSEHGSASLYADRFNFDTLDLMSFQIEDYIGALNAAAEAGYKVVIIDSTSHAWDALVERVERIAQTKYRGNTFSAWSEGTPLQKKLIEAMLTFPGHVIVTCRSKTEYSVDKDDKGKTTISKVGTAAVQRQGFEYEFTMAMTMDKNHVGFFSKDRTGKYQDKYIEKPGKDFGKQLIAWLNEGEIAPPKAPAPAPERTQQEVYNDTMKEIGNILQSKDEMGISIFTEKEQNDIRVKVKTDLSKLKTPEEKLAYVEKVLDDLKIAFHKKLEAPTNIAEEVTSEAVENAEVKTELAKAANDDGFEDDIPDETPPKKPGKKGSKPADGELDIY